MKNKKIKVFLGGYINSINAQNLNCRSLAVYLDKTKFEVGALSLYSGTLPLPDTEIKIFKVSYPHKLMRYLAYFRGILWSDVAYLPKGEIYNYCKSILKFLGKRSFITIEGVMSGTNYEKMLLSCKSDDEVRNFYNYTTRTFSITQFMANKNKELLNINSDGVLYLGIDLSQFEAEESLKKGLKNIVFIGNNMRYKGIDDIYSLAKIFPDLVFHIIGGGLGYDAAKEISERKLNNVVYHGLKRPDEIADILKGMDLHVFPSRSEGFPKVTLETAAAGAPSIVYSDYGASEWIISGKNGYVVDKFDEIVEIINDLKSNPAKLQKLSENAIIMTKRFDWKNVIKDWEKEIIEIVTTNKGNSVQ